MSLPTISRSTCLRCSRPAIRFSNMATSRNTFRQFASSSSASSSTGTPSSAPSGRWTRRFALTLLGLTIPTGYFFFPSSPTMTPHMYSNQPIKSTKSISTQHKLISVSIPSSSKEYFQNPYRPDGSLSNVKDEGEIIIQHMMIKSPDIQIERPYTPINDSLEDEEVRMVVKRVQGGEVGRVVHNLKDGDQVGIRGPIPTFSIYPHKYDKIIMISTGTAISPFLQLLSKLPSTSPSSSSPSSTTPSSVISKQIPKLHLIHSKPLEGREDWSNSSADSSFLPSLQEKFGSDLEITRIDPGHIPKEIMVETLKKEDGKVLVLVCLPPMLMRPLCGNILPNLSQGPITGVLGELGLTNEQVWKLE